jgi:hypothetical protein
MASKYFVAVRPQTNGNHPVHKDDCPFLPDDKHRIYLGNYSTGRDAVKEGLRHFDKPVCCPYCNKNHLNQVENHFSYLLTIKDKIAGEFNIPESSCPDLFCCLN